MDLPVCIMLCCTQNFKLIIETLLHFSEAVTLSDRRVEARYLLALVNADFFLFFAISKLSQSNSAPLKDVTFKYSRLSSCNEYD